MATLNMQALKEALRVSILLDLAKIDAVPQVKFSDSDTFLSEIYKRYEKNKKTKNHFTGKQLLAVIIAAIIIIASAVTAVAFKEKILNFFERKEDTHTSLNSPGGDGTNEEIKEVFLPTYIPEKFHLKSHESNCLFVLTYWTNGEKTIRLKQAPIMENERTLDTENGDYIEAVFGQQPIYYIVKHNAFNAVWHTEDYVYNFSAPYSLGLDELEKIIASISFYENIEQ